MPNHRHRYTRTEHRLVADRASKVYHDSPLFRSLLTALETGLHRTPCPYTTTSQPPSRKRPHPSAPLCSWCSHPLPPHRLSCRSCARRNRHPPMNTLPPSVEQRSFMYEQHQQPRDTAPLKRSRLSKPALVNPQTTYPETPCIQQRTPQNPTPSLFETPSRHPHASELDLSPPLHQQHTTTCQPPVAPYAHSVVSHTTHDPYAVSLLDAIPMPHSYNTPAKYASSPQGAFSDVTASAETAFDLSYQTPHQSTDQMPLRDVSPENCIADMLLGDIISDEEEDAVKGNALSMSFLDALLPPLDATLA